MQNDFAVIGANGMQGKIVSRDLLESGYSVFLCAIDDYGLASILHHQRARFARVDLRHKDALRDALRGSGVKVLVNCALDDFNLEVMRTALELGIHYVDLGSEAPMWHEQKKLHQALQEKGVLAISGIGSTPGITNIMLRYLKPRFDTIETVHLGFAWDSNLPVFVPPFSIDAIAYEFSEPATIFENGTFVTKSPLEPTGIDYEYRAIGKQLTCYTKHIEHHTFPEFLQDMGVQNVVVYSSFPPHSYQAIRRLVELGFLSKEPIELHGAAIRPLDFTIEVLRRMPIPAGYVEKENVWIKVYGKKDGAPRREEMDCIASTIPGWEDATCNVDTAFPASILAQMILNNQIAARGFYSPEAVVPPEPFFAALHRRQMVVYDNGKALEL
jgi:saccharopine dehydrogenase-like NADP-dependent oxidoreductase